MKTYKIWITFYGSTAKNVGIIGSAQHTQSTWASGKLERIPINDGSQEYYEFMARDDDRAFFELNRLFAAKHPNNKRPIAGKSYLRSCKVKET